MEREERINSKEGDKYNAGIAMMMSKMYLRVVAGERKSRMEREKERGKEEGKERKEK
jgi:hypothetical protein